jgi:hypothetical protein
MSAENGQSPNASPVEPTPAETVSVTPMMGANVDTRGVSNLIKVLRTGQGLTASGNVEPDQPTK